MGEDIVTRLITMSVQASALILTVMLIRLFTKKSVSPRLHYALWLLPTLRLLLPFRFTSGLSLMNLAQTHANPVNSQTYSAQSAYVPPAVDPAVIQGPEIPAVTVVPQVQPVSPVADNAAPSLSTILFWIWVCGAALVLAYTLYVNIRFYAGMVRSRSMVSCDCTLPVYRVPGLFSPCLCGCFRPVILINDAALRNAETLSFVFKHELSHFRAGDSWWALLRSLCCALHWFNPLVWWAAFASRTDCELACDARVMKGFTQAEREAYGMALLSIIRMDGKKPALIHTTTSMTGGKRELRERVTNIGRRPRTLASVVALVALIMAAVAFVACSESETSRETSAVSAEPATMPTPEAASFLAPTPEAAPFLASTLTPEEAELARRTLNGDFDGDGQPDTALVEGYMQNHDDENPRATLTVTLATGETASYDLPGYWDAHSIMGGDFDGDGAQDMALFLIAQGSNFDGGEARVLCMENGALSEFPYAVNTNPALPFEQGGTLLGAGGCMIGVVPIKAGERDGLRVQIPIDVTANAPVPTAWYMDIAFNGEAWDTLSMGLGEAYQNSLLPDTGPLPKVETVHRQGFTEAALTFTGSNTIEPQDPYLRYYDWRTATLSPTAQDMAQDMLRQLYDMTGVLIDKCYVSGTWDRLYFSMERDGSPCFLSTGYGASSQDGKLIYMFNIDYGGPIDPTEIVKPAGYENMTKPELARWYYNNSSYGDRREIVSAADHFYTGYVKLTLATGEFYEVGFDEASGLPNSFYGPYPEGFRH